MRKYPKEYIINPNTGGVIWWYVTDEHRPEFRTGDEDHRFTWFGGVREDWEDFGQFNLAITKKYLLEVQIEAPAGCAVFDARRLFPNMPQWVKDSLLRSTQIDAEELDSEEGYEFIENVRPMAIETDTYKFFQNMRIVDPSLEAFTSRKCNRDQRVEFLIKLWLLDWSAVQTFLEMSEYTEEVDTPIVGWYEIERVDYNYHTAINLGLYMAEPANLASHFQGCSDINVDIVNVISNARTNPQNLPIYVNNLGVHTNAPIPLYHATTAADAIIKEGFKTPDELPRGSFGLGSSGMDLISMTGDPRYAEAICVHMAIHARIGIGDLRWSELMADFRRVSPERYQRIVDGSDQGNKAKGLIRVLKVMDKGQVPVNQTFGEMYLTTDPERYELVSMEEYVEYRREYCVSNNLEHMINSYTNPAKSTLAELYNELLWINDGTIENPVGDSYLWTRFLGQDLSILDQIAYVRAELKSGMRIVSRNSSVEMPSVFYGRSGQFSVEEYKVQKLKRGEDLYPRSSWGSYRAPVPLPESETGLTFDIDPEFVDRVPAEEYNKFAIYLFAEDEFRLPAPRDQLTPAVLYGTAMDILEVLPDLWQGKDVTCFYPRIGDKRKTLRDNLLD